MPIPSDYSKPKRKTAKETAFNQIQQWIIDGTLHPGEKLYDTELAKALGIEQEPVRESLQLLETQGFVEMFPGKATQVTAVNKESTYRPSAPLAALQALSAELAIPNLTEDQLTLLEDTNSRFAKVIRYEDYFTALKIDEEFHQIIVDAADNPYIFSIVDSLQAHVRRLFFHNSIVLTKSSIDEHNDIIKLMRERDVESVSTLMQKSTTGYVRLKSFVY